MRQDRRQVSEAALWVSMRRKKGSQRGHDGDTGPNPLAHAPSEPLVTVHPELSPDLFDALADEGESGARTAARQVRDIEHPADQFRVLDLAQKGDGTPKGGVPVSTDARDENAGDWVPVLDSHAGK